MAARRKKSYYEGNAYTMPAPVTGQSKGASAAHTRAVKKAAKTPRGTPPGLNYRSKGASAAARRSK